MATNPLLTLLAQAMMALPFVLPIIFAGLCCGAYLVLLVVNAAFALVNGYRRRPQRLLMSLKAMAITALITATLICVWFLCNIDGSYI